MLLGIVSDTHGHIANTVGAIRVLEERNVDAVVHCGDIGSTDVVLLFAGRPTHFVFGNVDHDEQALRTAIEDAGLTCHDRFGTLEREGKRIAFLHGDDEMLLNESIASGDYDLVCRGHTHVAGIEVVNGTSVLNPGALYRAAVHTIAMVELPSLDIEHVEV